MAETPTDPRAARTRALVLAAAATVIAEEGAGAVTHQHVAERAGVGRATMYRHWPTAVDLLYDALAEADSPLFRPGDGPLLPWLRAELLRISADLSQPHGLQFASALMSRVQFDPAAVTLRDRLVARSMVPLSRAVDRAVAEGVLTAAPPIDDLLAALVGPLQFKAMSGGPAASPEFVEAVIVGALGRYLPG